MSKRAIIAAAKRKGVEFAYLDYSVQTTPGGSIGCWEISLAEDSEVAIGEADPDFKGWQPDCSNVAEVMAWIETLPDIRAIAAGATP